jgi:hypothetical protein
MRNTENALSKLSAMQALRIRKLFLASRNVFSFAERKLYFPALEISF